MIVVTCREVISFLIDYLTNDLDMERRSAFERHLAVCDSCVQYIATYQTTIRLAMRVSEVHIEDVPEDLVKAILGATGH